jgi:hypothetical protein
LQTSENAPSPTFMSKGKKKRKGRGEIPRPHSTTRLSFELKPSRLCR